MFFSRDLYFIYDRWGKWMKRLAVLIVVFNCCLFATKYQPDQFDMASQLWLSGSRLTGEYKSELSADKQKQLYNLIQELNERKQKLIEKMQNGSLTVEEQKELRRIIGTDIKEFL
jgi:adenylate kinase family enzyme